MNWTTEEAIKLCTALEPLCMQNGCHVALTGGTLYKIGQRKDLDIVLYRIRQQNVIDLPGLFQAWQNAGLLQVASGFGWCYKAHCDGKPVDIFVPEETKVVKAEFENKTQGISVSVAEAFSSAGAGP